MKALTAGYLFRVALVGILAGLVAALFHALATEPLIDQAIALEEELASAAGESPGEPVVTRDMQRGGLWLGFGLYGLVWALLFGLVYAAAHRWFRGSGFGRALALAGLVYWAVALFPFLKYPANPPGVGDPETIAYRQGLYLAFLGLSVLGTALAAAVGVRLKRAGWLWALACVALYSAVLFLLMPANPDRVRMPEGMVASFRVLSLGGLTLFWLVLGLGFGLLLGRSSQLGPASRLSAAET